MTGRRGEQIGTAAIQEGGPVVEKSLLARREINEVRKEGGNLGKVGYWHELAWTLGKVTIQFGPTGRIWDSKMRSPSPSDLLRQGLTLININ